MFYFVFNIYKANYFSTSVLFLYFYASTQRIEFEKSQTTNELRLTQQSNVYMNKTWKTLLYITDIAPIWGKGIPLNE